MPRVSPGARVRGYDERVADRGALPDLSTRARVGMAVNARDVADSARALLGDACAPLPHDELIRKARLLRAQTQTLVDRAVMAAIADGADWAEVAAAVGMPEADARTIYEPTWEVWLEPGSEPELDRGDMEVGTMRDADLAGTADTLDQWWRRHADPWEKADAPGPVRALVDGQPPARDR